MWKKLSASKSIGASSRLFSIGAKDGAESVITLAITYYCIKHTQRHLLVTIENN